MRKMIPDKANKPNTTTTAIKEALTRVLLFSVAFIVFRVVLSVNFVPSESMEPTIKRSHLIVSYRLNCLIRDPVPELGTVIVFRENGGKQRLLIKRVIGLPGDTVSFSEGKVYRNGEGLEEPYLLKQGVSYSAVTEFHVPDGLLFVLGDNREQSNDSRFMEGTFVPIKNVYAWELFQVPFCF